MVQIGWRDWVCVLSISEGCADRSGRQSDKLKISKPSSVKIYQFTHKTLSIHSLT